MMWLKLPLLGWLFAAGLWVMTGAARGACSCQCVEGVAHTLCTSIDEARQNPYACGAAGQQVACPVPADQSPAPILYDPPEGASNCRSVRLWEPDSSSYGVTARVCEATAALPAAQP